MGVAPSKIEDDKVLVLCQERKRFIREAIDGRCAFAAAHYDYIQSLRDTGYLLRKCFEPEAPKEWVPNLAPSLLHINHRKSGGNSMTTYQEKVSVPVTVQSAAPVARHPISELESSASFETPTGTPPWDCFGQIHPVDNRFLVQDKNKLGQDFDNEHEIRRLRKEEGIPQLEAEGEGFPANAGEEEDFLEAKDDFDNPSTETSVPVSKNQNTSTEQSSAHHASETVRSENITKTKTDSQSDRLKNERTVIGVCTNGNQSDANHAMPPVYAVPSSAAALPMDSREPYPCVNIAVKDLYSGMKEIEILFFSAFDSGKEVTKTLEGDKIQFRALLPDEIAHGSKASSFLTTLFACCREDVLLPETPPQAEVKYLTWHRSVSSQLLPSTNPPGTNVGMRNSTLDRLYAWEDKLYDEVKASGAIYRRYDEKRKQLRDQESRGKNQIHIDFTRATVKDLHSRILVAIQKIHFISKNIEDIRDKELQPQLDELIRSLTRMWATMLECHQRQHAIIKLVSSTCNVKISFQSESQCQAVLLLLSELSKLCSGFQSWVASHKAYLHSLNLWLHRCMKPLKKRKGSRKQNIIDVSLTECAVPLIFTTCEIWIKFMEDLPTKDLEEAIEGLIADVRHSVPHLEQMLNGETGGEIRRNHVPPDLQSSLVTFMQKLEAFSGLSLEKYIDLQKNISATKERLLRD